MAAQPTSRDRTTPRSAPGGTALQYLSRLFYQYTIHTDAIHTALFTQIIYSSFFDTHTRVVLPQQLVHVLVQQATGPAH